MGFYYDVNKCSITSKVSVVLESEEKHAMARTTPCTNTQMVDVCSGFDHVKPRHWCLNPFVFELNNLKLGSC